MLSLVRKQSDLFQRRDWIIRKSSKKADHCHFGFWTEFDRLRGRKRVAAGTGLFAWARFRLFVSIAGGTRSKPVIYERLGGEWTAETSIDQIESVRSDGRAANENWSMNIIFNVESGSKLSLKALFAPNKYTSVRRSFHHPQATWQVPDVLTATSWMTLLHKGTTAIYRFSTTHCDKANQIR